MNFGFDIREQVELRIKCGINASTEAKEFLNLWIRGSKMGI